MHNRPILFTKILSSSVVGIRGLALFLNITKDILHLNIRIYRFGFHFFKLGIFSTILMNQSFVFGVNVIY